MSKQVTMHCDLCGKNLNRTFFRYSIKACHLIDGEVEECENHYMNQFDTAFDLCGDCIITLEKLREEKIEQFFKKLEGNANDKEDQMKKIMKKGDITPQELDSLYKASAKEVLS